MKLHPERSNHHLVITGVGRTGTTALMQLFSYLDMPTGFDRESCWAVDGVSRAGLEVDITQGNPPYIVKSPNLVDWLKKSHQERTRLVDCAIVPMRDFWGVVDSRLRVFDHHIKTGNLNALGAPGSLWKADWPEDQAHATALAFFDVMENLSRWQIPVLMPHYPTMTTSVDHVWQTLNPVFAQFGVSRDRLEKAHREVMNQHGKRPERVRFSEVAHRFRQNKEK